jgi:hypothetical protein
MRKFTTEHTVYNFDELSDEAKQKALEKLYDINVEFDWWDMTYEDTLQFGIDICGFDLYRQECDIKLTKDMQEVCKLLMAEWGKEHNLYQLAKKWQFKHGEDNEAEFVRELEQEYLSHLQDDYDYLTSDEAIIETINANEYEFNEDGSLA